MAEYPRRRAPRGRGPAPSPLSHDASPQQLADALHALLEGFHLSHDERLQALASAFVVEAFRPYWTDHHTPEEAHQALVQADPELAQVIAVIAPMLLGHIEVHEEARDAIASVEALLGIPR